MYFIECAMEQIIQVQFYKSTDHYGLDPYELSERGSRC
jgi:hypothetical protein